MSIEKTFLLFGIIFSLLGIALMLGLKWPKLPGDIVIKKEGFTFVFPLTSSIIISIILTIIFNLIFRR